MLCILTIAMIFFTGPSEPFKKLCLYKHHEQPFYRTVKMFMIIRATHIIFSNNTMIKIYSIPLIILFIRLFPLRISFAAKTFVDMNILWYTFQQISETTFQQISEIDKHIGEVYIYGWFTISTRNHWSCF